MKVEKEPRDAAGEVRAVRIEEDLAAVDCMTVIWPLYDRYMTIDRYMTRIEEDLAAIARRPPRVARER